MNDSHPDDDRLSADLDDVGDPADAAHIAACASCSSRLDDLRAVSFLIGGAVPPAAEATLDRAVTAARAAWRVEYGTVSGGRRTPPAAPFRDGPTPLRPGPASVAGGRAGPRRPPPWLLGVAAAAALVLAAVPVLMSGDRSRPPTQAAGAPADGRATGAMAERATDSAAAAGARQGPDGSGQEALTAAPTTSASTAPRAAPREASPTGSAAVAPTVVDGGNLGDQTDAGAVARAVAGALPGSRPPDTIARTPEPAPSLAMTPGGAADQAPPAASPSGPTDLSCDATVRSAAGEPLGALIYAASATYRATPAVVLVYRVADPAGSDLDYRLFVTARQGCRLLDAVHL